MMKDEDISDESEIHMYLGHRTGFCKIIYKGLLKVSGKFEENMLVEGVIEF